MRCSAGCTACASATASCPALRCSKKGWGFTMAGVVQCTREGLVGDVKAQLDANEGCNVAGRLVAPKVAGNLHFAPGACPRRLLPLPLHGRRGGPPPASMQSPSPE